MNMASATRSDCRSCVHPKLIIKSSIEVTNASGFEISCWGEMLDSAIVMVLFVCSVYLSSCREIQVGMAD